MTPQEAFIKAATDRFDEEKMAGWGDVIRQAYKGFSGPKGTWENALRHAGTAWRASDPAHLWTPVVLGGLGGAAGYANTDPEDSLGSKMFSVGTGLASGFGLGHLASGHMSDAIKAWQAGVPKGVVKR